MQHFFLFLEPQAAVRPTELSVQWAQNIKQPRRHADLSPPFSPEVNKWSRISTPPIRLNCVIRDNFTYTMEEEA
jgi:hypothetical protein